MFHIWVHSYGRYIVTLTVAFVPQTARRHAPAELATFARPIPASPPSGAWNVPRNLCDVRPDTWLGQSWGEYGNIWKRMEYGMIFRNDTDVGMSSFKSEASHRPRKEPPTALNASPSVRVRLRQD